MATRTRPTITRDTSILFRMKQCATTSNVSAKRIIGDGNRVDSSGAKTDDGKIM
jgi:hypothetical protein